MDESGNIDLCEYKNPVMKATVFENKTPMSWHLLVHKQT